jgi:Kdo2-lipid IVA lauroyltransferase/acyltransferase
MPTKLFNCIVFLLSKLGLKNVHRIGKYFGITYFWIRKKNYSLLIDNLDNAKIFTKINLADAISINTQELGKSILETFYLWASNQSIALSLVKNVYGLDCLKSMHSNGKGIIFLTPHLGCFEITSIFYGAQNPITIMYRKARKNWMNDLMVKGRKKGMVKLATPDIQGLKKILLALKKGEAVGILPDQVADKGQGEWANFFGKPAYTMVLIKKLIQKTDANIVMAYGERLADGAGYNIYLEKVDKKDITSTEDLNKQIERFIRKNPTQYYWSYDRYKKIAQR